MGEFVNNTFSRILFSKKHVTITNKREVYYYDVHTEDEPEEKTDVTELALDKKGASNLLLFHTNASNHKQSGEYE